MTTCPMCAEDVAPTDSVCPHCGNLLGTAATAAGAPPAMSPSPATAIPTHAAKDTLAERARQWAVPAVLTVAVVLAVVVKFAWWDRRWQGTRDACEVVTSLTQLRLDTEAINLVDRRYFAGSSEASGSFTVELAGSVSRLSDQRVLRTNGIPAETVERLYVASVEPHGVLAASAQGAFRDHRDEILRAIGPHLGDFLTTVERADLRAAAASCRDALETSSGNTSAAPADAGVRVTSAASTVVPAQPATPAPPSPNTAEGAQPPPRAESPPSTVAVGGTPVLPPCVASCIRTHRAAYERCAGECVRGGSRASECNDECGHEYDACLLAQCNLTSDQTPWFRPDTQVLPETPRATACTYATHDGFHLRARPTVSRDGAVEVRTNPVVELLRAEEIRRGSEQMFQVRLQDGSGREGWMFIPIAEVPPGCAS